MEIKELLHIILNLIILVSCILIVYFMMKNHIEEYVSNQTGNKTKIKTKRKTKKQRRVLKVSSSEKVSNQNTKEMFMRKKEIEWNKLFDAPFKPELYEKQWEDYSKK